MLTAYFKSASTTARYRAGSAGPHLDRFVAWLADQGYRRVSIRRHVREVVNFATWAESAGFGTAPLDRSALAQLHDSLTARGRLHYPSGNRRHVHQSACIFVRFLEVIGAVPTTTVVPVQEGHGVHLFVVNGTWTAPN